MATHKPTGKKLAVKKILKENIRNWKMQVALQTEIEIHKKLKHPNIVRFYKDLEDRKY